MDCVSPSMTGVVAAVVAIAGIVDMRHFRVPNILTIPLLGCGILYHTAAYGFDGLQSSLLGALLGFGVLFGLYLIGAMGAGDVKLMAAVGAWAGAETTVFVFAIAAAATGLYSIVILLWQGRLGHAFTTIQMALCQCTTLAKHLGAAERVESVVRQKDRRKRLVPFAAMIALGLVVVIAWQ